MGQHLGFKKDYTLDLHAILKILRTTLSVPAAKPHINKMSYVFIHLLLISLKMEKARQLV